MDSASSEHHPRRLRIDCQDGTVELLDDSAGSVLKAKFPKSLESSGPFRLVFAIAIAQHDRSTSAQPTDWPGVDQDLFERLIRGPLSRSFDVAAGTTYWSQLGSMSQPFVAFTPDTAAADLGRQVFQLIRKRGPFPKLRFLGDRLPVEGGRFRYSELHIESDAGEPWCELRKDIEDYLRRYRPGEFSSVELVDEADARLKELLLKDAQEGLAYCLHQEHVNDYQQPQLEILQDADEYPTPRSDTTERAVTDGWEDSSRISHPITINSLVPPDASYVILAPSGAGKTTLLRWLQVQINAKSDWYAAFVSTHQILSTDPLTSRSLMTQIVLRLERRDNPALVDAFERAWEAGKVVLLVDALDSPGSSRWDAGDLTRTLLAMLQNTEPGSSGGSRNALVATSRPTKAPEVRDNAGLRCLLLLPFTRADLRRYFGDRVGDAEAMVAWNRSLLQSPMISYIVRALLDKPPDKPVASLWQLYERFVTYVLRKHVPSRGMPVRSRWADDVVAFLAELAYYALDRREPDKEVVPVRADTPHPRKHHLDDYELDAAGLAALIWPNANRVSSSYQFAHLSFQEYFAAQQIAQHEALLAHVIEEYWNPKWHEVLRFLAGCPALHIIERLYAGPKDDDMLCSRLFAACHASVGADVDKDTSSVLRDAVLRCALTTAAHGRRRSVVAEMISFERPSPGWGFHPEHELFRDGVRALCNIGTEESCSEAWAAIHALFRAGIATQILRDDDLLRSLYSEQRFAVCLEAWREVWSETVGPRERERLCYGWTALLSGWGAHLCPEDVEKAVLVTIQHLQAEPPVLTAFDRMTLVSLGERIAVRQLEELMPLRCQYPDTLLRVMTAACVAGGCSADHRRRLSRCLESYEEDGMRHAVPARCVAQLCEVLGARVNRAVGEQCVLSWVRTCGPLGAGQRKDLGELIRGWVPELPRQWCSAVLECNGGRYEEALKGLGCVPEAVSPAVVARLPSLIDGSEYAGYALGLLAAVPASSQTGLDEAVDRAMEMVQERTEAGDHAKGNRKQALRHVLMNLNEGTLRRMRPERVQACVEAIDGEEVLSGIECCRVTFGVMTREQRRRVIEGILNAVARKGTDTIEAYWELEGMAQSYCSEDAAVVDACVEDVYRMGGRQRESVITYTLLVMVPGRLLGERTARCIAKVIKAEAWLAHAQKYGALKSALEECGPAFLES